MGVIQKIGTAIRDLRLAMKPENPDELTVGSEVQRVLAYLMGKDKNGFLPIASNPWGMLEPFACLPLAQASWQVASGSSADLLSEAWRLVGYQMVEGGGTGLSGACWNSIAIGGFDRMLQPCTMHEFHYAVVFHRYLWFSEPGAANLMAYFRWDLPDDYKP